MNSKKITSVAFVSGFVCAIAMSAMGRVGLQALPDGLNASSANELMLDADDRGFLVIFAEDGTVGKSDEDFVVRVARNRLSPPQDTSVGTAYELKPIAIWQGGIWGPCQPSPDKACPPIPFQPTEDGSVLLLPENVEKAVPSP